MSQAPQYDMILKGWHVIFPASGLNSGVTAVVDQGGASWMTFPAYRYFIAEEAATRCYAFMSAYVVGGLQGHYYPELHKRLARRRRK